MFHGARQVWSVTSQQLDTSIGKALLDVIPVFLCDDSPVKTKRRLKIAWDKFYRFRNPIREIRIRNKWRRDKRHLPLTPQHKPLYVNIHRWCWYKLRDFPDLVNCRDFNDRIQWLKLFDHSAIYLLIAGTYTPLLLVAVGGWLGITMTAVVWLLALGGVVFKLIAQHRFPRISVATYLLLGWIALGLIYPLYVALPGAGLWLIVAGGLCFSIGVFFYVAKKVKYTHAIWHLFVLGGCSCHYFSIYYYVV